MSRTEENLRAAFAGECQAHARYLYFGKKARKEGFHQVAAIFEETAKHELQHAKNQFKLLKGIESTIDNLKEAIASEEFEITTLYPEFAAQAREEGHKEAALLFEQIAKVEAEHKKRFQKLLKQLETDTHQERKTPIKWRCIKCGYINEGKKPLPKCPACNHPKEYFEAMDG